MLGALTLYFLGRWFFAWRQAQSEGHRHPAHTALHELGDDEPTSRSAPGGFASWKEFLRFVLVAVVIAAIAGLTSGALRIALLACITPLLVLALAYLDSREKRTARESSPRTTE
ncbi:hypothetical protein [Streptomyces sp. cg35]|uniref:hypothetical protein n=1 Tax=Streptomyces sp. cg35 TaxID=3421650 RepID=UPI003D16836E